jgi:hypothetical protein
MNQQAALKPCPKCQSAEKVLPIRYGYPGAGMQKDAKEGKIKLGGCCVSNERHFCNTYQLRFI